MSISSILSNNALSSILEMYNDGTYSNDKNAELVQKWIQTLQCVTETTLALFKDISRMEKLINGKG